MNETTDLNDLTTSEIQTTSSEIPTLYDDNSQSTSFGLWPGLVAMVVLFLAAIFKYNKNTKTQAKELKIEKQEHKEDLKTAVKTINTLTKDEKKVYNTIEKQEKQSNEITNQINDLIQKNIENVEEYESNDMPTIQETNERISKLLNKFKDK